MRKSNKEAICISFDGYKWEFEALLRVTDQKGRYHFYNKKAMSMKEAIKAVFENVQKEKRCSPEFLLKCLEKSTL